MLSLAVNSLVFGALYSWTNWLAEKTHVIALPPGLFGRSVPFVAWTVLPYFSSGLAFALAFLVTAERRQLRLLSQRTLLVTALAAACFALMPLRFPLARPVVDDALPAVLFSMLDGFDRPFNQLPSLHAAYAVLFWPNLRAACRTGTQRLLVAVWLLLLIASALFTWQHNPVDLIAGAALGIAAQWLIRRPLHGARAVSFFYGLAGATVIVLLAWPLRSLLAAWFGASLLLVAFAYARRDAGFLHKRDGRHPAWAWTCYAPYLAGYWLSWQFMRLARRQHPPLVQCAPQLWAGRRLGNAEADLLPRDCHVIDLSCELGEIAALRGARYLYVPLLDLHAPNVSVLRRLRQTIADLRSHGSPVFIHCAMGLARSRLVVRIVTRGKRHERIDLPA